MAIQRQCGYASSGLSRRPLEFDLPPVKTASGVSEAIGMIAKQMADGVVSPDEASAVAAVIETQRRAIETCEHEQRLQKLEAMSIK